MKRNKQHIFSKIIFIWLITSAVSIEAQDTTSIFWEVTGNGLDKPSYLYGTVHMIGQSDFFLSDEVENKFKSCDEIVMEIDMDAPDLLTKTQQLMFMPDKNIKELLNENEYLTLEKFFKDSLSLSLEQFQKIKPIFLTQFIVTKIINEPMASYESVFVRMAQKYKLEISGIETVEEQMNLLDSIPFDRQAKLVLETINEFNESRLIYRQLIAAYKKMNFENFYGLMFRLSKELEEFEQLLLIDRNLKWIPRIEKLIENKSCFIAVGALHLEGEKGLVSLLKSKGYKLKPI